MNNKISFPLADAAQSQFMISVVIPTRNEAGNIEHLLARISQATKGIPTEVVFVDDSNDNTVEVIRNQQGRFPVSVSLIARSPERRVNGLGGAVVEGIAISKAPWVCVMDADLQHPPELIPRILRHAGATRSDLVVGSRLAPGGDTKGLGFKRSLISRVFAAVTRTAFPLKLRKVTDPLSGFFLVRRSALDLKTLRPDGFKILLEILIQFPALKVSEMPIQFGYRHAGDSKASVLETIRFFRLLLRLRLAGEQPLIRFLTVGASGLVVNSLLLALFTELAGFHYLLSAVLATQFSTLWNFGLSETWVFSRHKPDSLFLQRLVSFMLMNNLLLFIRGPLLSIMVTSLGLHYLISNLLSLIAMTLARYAVADRWIWKKAVTIDSTKPVRRPVPMSTTTTSKTNHSPYPQISGASGQQNEAFIFSYNIHNILQIASMFELPELEYFRVPGILETADIRLRLERRYKDRRHEKSAKKQSTFGSQRRSENQRRFDNLIHYRESPGRFGFELSIAYKNCVEIAVSPILRLSLHVLYTNIVEPILRWALVRKGYALVHAACVSMDGKAVLVTARTDTGKTSTILRAVENYACSFLSDDMTIVSREGLVMSYPKPLTISNHTLSALNGHALLSRLEKLALQVQSRLHSRSGRSVGMKLSETRLPAATMNTIVQMLIPPPKYMVHRLIPGVIYADRATLSGAVVIERGPEFEEVLHHDQAVEVFVHNAEDAYGFPPYPILANSLSKWDEKDLHPQEQAIVAEALSRIPAVRLRDPKFNWWQRLPVINSPKTLAGIQQFAVADD